MPQLDGQRAVVAYSLTGGWRLADDEAVNRHRVRRQPDWGHVQAEPAGHLHARAVEQPRDSRHDHPGMRIRIRLQRFLVRRGPPHAARMSCGAASGSTPSTSYHVISLIIGHRCGLAHRSTA